MTGLKLGNFYTKCIPSKKKRFKGLSQRKYLMKGQPLGMENTPRVDFSVHPIVLPIPKKLESSVGWEPLSKHVIGSFQLEFHRDSVRERLEIKATLPSPRVPEKTTPNPEDEQLYELFVCNSQGQLLAKIPFLESDYRRAAHKAIDSMSI
ncbi:uncharacterized protein LOC108049024 [Drosophila rhopaloa]|uniref:Uncharacterized protein LOC108049024 n=1 Tax=Drosophila rhopaloa TaxID=1041015 RepID=A0A6P4FJM8_DRORH|nr:uncharacterized protein LOC108049024 [Drosophila rhopaloa]